MEYEDQILRIENQVSSNDYLFQFLKFGKSLLQVVDNIINMFKAHR